MWVHTGEGLESGQSQTKQDDWTEEAQKDSPHTSDLKDLQWTCCSLTLLLFLCFCLSLHLPLHQSLPFFPHSYLLSLLSYLPHYSQSLCQILSPKGQVLGTYINWLGFSVLTPQPPTWEWNEAPYYKAVNSAQHHIDSKHEMKYDCWEQAWEVYCSGCLNCFFLSIGLCKFHISLTQLKHPDNGNDKSIYTLGFLGWLNISIQIKHPEQCLVRRKDSKTVSPYYCLI